MESASPSEQSREKIRQTIERAIPRIEIDQTKVLSDEELAELRRRWEKEKSARELADREGHEGLQARLKRTMSQFEVVKPGAIALPRTDLEPNP